MCNRCMNRREFGALTTAGLAGGFSFFMTSGGCLKTEGSDYPQVGGAADENRGTKHTAAPDEREQASCPSTLHEQCRQTPIVADVDGDFNAELVVPSNVNCGTSPSTAGGVSYPDSPNGHPMDPFFKGLRCETGADCLSGSCDAGFCRCTNDDGCGGTGSGFVCAGPVAGTPGTGNT